MNRRTIILTLLAALVAASCAVGERPTLLDVSSDRDSANDVEFAPGAGPLPDEILPLPFGTEAVVTRTGVVVEAFGRTSEGKYVVTTPCGIDVTLDFGQPVEPVQVVLDAGHGGDEPGAQDIEGLSEAELNLRVVRSLIGELNKRGITSMVIRNADYRIPVSRRAALADAIDPEIFVSIHHNNGFSAKSDKPGTETYYQHDSEASKRLAGLLYEEVVNGLSQFDIEWTSRFDAGALTVVDDEGEDAYGINRRPETPSVLIEMAYMGNPNEAEILQTDEYLEVGAESLARGIERYLSTEDEGSGFVAEPRIFNPSSETGGTSGCVDPDIG